MERQPHRDPLKRASEAGLDLLGYVLGALDADEAAKVAAALEADPELREAVDRLYGTLPRDCSSWVDPPPPAGLMRRTLELIDSHPWHREGSSPERELMSAGVEASDALGLAGGERELHFGVRGTSWLDVAVSAAVVVAFATLVLPALINSRYHAHLVSCADNLRAVGMALGAYADIHRGLLPSGVAGSPTGVAGGYASILAEQRLISDDSVICPASDLAERQGFSIPALSELQRLRPAALAAMQRMMGGSYAFTLGFAENGVIQDLRRDGSPFRAVLADRAEALFPGHNSAHAGRGANVLFDDGHYMFVRFDVSHPIDEHLFRNRIGEIAPGLDPDDSVLAPSETPLFGIPGRMVPRDAIGAAVR